MGARGGGAVCHGDVDWLVIDEFVEYWCGSGEEMVCGAGIGVRKWMWGMAGVSVESGMAAGKDGGGVLGGQRR